MSFSKGFYGMDSKFVYYNDLQRTYPSIYDSLMKRKGIFDSEYHDKLYTISGNLKSWANNEAKKESRMLREFFGRDINFEMGHYSLETGRQIIRAINETISFKEAFERHITRIVGKDGVNGTAKISAPQFFASYFKEEFYNVVSETYNQNKANLLNMTLLQVGEVLFSDENINKALERTFFQRMANSGDWSKTDKKHGYEELFKQIENFNKDGFLKQVKEAYKLDSFKSRLMEDLNSTKELEDIFKNKKTGTSYVRKKIKETTTAKGTLGEIIGAVSAEAAALAFQSGGGNSFNVTSNVVGSSGGKADMVMTLDLDPSRLMGVIEKSYQDRAERVDAYKELNKYLKNVNKGYIIYTNAKDYSLIKKPMGKDGYTFQGFSAGSAISLASFEGVISGLPGGSQTLIGQIMNTMEGAVYSDEKDEIETIICEKMAYLLFDDVLTIGNQTDASSHAIHLMYLDGIYMPMSCMFYLMGEAIESVASGKSFSADEIFDVTLNPGSIAFPNGPWQPGDWHRQKQIAYSQIKISAVFLRSFVDIIREIM